LDTDCVEDEHRPEWWLPDFRLRFIQSIKAKPPWHALNIATKLSKFKCIQYALRAVASVFTAFAANGRFLKPRLSPMGTYVEIRRRPPPRQRRLFGRGKTQATALPASQASMALRSFSGSGRDVFVSGSALT
jgi:hypothetical protein